MAGTLTSGASFSPMVNAGGVAVADPAGIFIGDELSDTATDVYEEVATDSFAVLEGAVAGRAGEALDSFFVALGDAWGKYGGMMQNFGIAVPAIFASAAVGAKLPFFLPMLVGETSENLRLAKNFERAQKYAEAAGYLGREAEIHISARRHVSAILILSEQLIMLKEVSSPGERQYSDAQEKLSEQVRLAKSSIERLISENKGGSEVKAALKMVQAFVEEAAGKFDMAVNSLQGSMKVLTDDVDDSGFWLDAQIMTLETRARIAMAGKLINEAVASIVEGYELIKDFEDEDVPSERSDTISFYMTAADVYEKAGRKEDALEALEGIADYIDETTTYIGVRPEFMRRRGVLEIELGDFENGIEHMVDAADDYLLAGQNAKAAEVFLELATLLAVHRRSELAEISIYYARAFRLFRESGLLHGATTALNAMMEILKTAAQTMI